MKGLIFIFEDLMCEENKTENTIQTIKENNTYRYYPINTKNVL